MNIRLKVSMAGKDFSFFVGQEVNVDDKTAKQWIEAGVAEAVKIEKANKNQDTASK